MDSMIKVFENEQFGQVRTTIIDGDIWFVANDVFRVLAISNSKDALRMLDGDEKTGVDIIDPHGRVHLRFTTLITPKGQRYFLQKYAGKVLSDEEISAMTSDMA